MCREPLGLFASRHVFDPWPIPTPPYPYPWPTAYPGPLTARRPPEGLYQAHLLRKSLSGTILSTLLEEARHV